MNNNIKNNPSYSDVVLEMNSCLEDLRSLGKGDIKVTRELVGKALMDSGFIDNNGRIIVREKRAPHIEEFFRRIEAETETSKQKVRKK